MFILLIQYNVRFLMFILLISKSSFPRTNTLINRTHFSNGISYNFVQTNSKWNIGTRLTFKTNWPTDRYHTFRQYLNKNIFGIQKKVIKQKRNILCVCNNVNDPFQCSTTLLEYLTINGISFCFL